MPEENRPSRLQTAHLWADLVSKLLGGAALLVAAWWTYTNFTVERTHDPTMEVTVSPSVHPLGGEQGRHHSTASTSPSSSRGTVTTTASPCRSTASAAPDQTDTTRDTPRPSAIVTFRFSSGTIVLSGR